MKHAALVTLAALAFVLAGQRLLPAAPQPAEVSTSWELDFSFQPIQPIQITLPGHKTPTTFWFMFYTVTNHTNADQVFVPEIALCTDTGQVLRSGAPSSVFQAIKQTFGEPLLKDQLNITGNLLRGDDNAKLGVAIFSDIDPEAGAFDIFVGGLSGETFAIDLPVPIPGPKGTTLTSAVLSKTLQLHYALPGEASARNRNTPKLTSKTWVMR